MVLVDRRPTARFTVSPPKADQILRGGRHLIARITVPAGAHDVGITFLKNPTPASSRPGASPTRRAITCTGIRGSHGRVSGIRHRPLPLHRRRRHRYQRMLFGAPAQLDENEDARAERILRTFARRAYRRPVGSDDGTTARVLSRSAVRRRFRCRTGGGSECHPCQPGISSPDRTGTRPMHRLAPFTGGDVPLASRLSFFLEQCSPTTNCSPSLNRANSIAPG